ncbi:uncharacterized protein FIBRA_03014 [Fibroporia radiculosa]|uniref:Uncharacterized protein n=1 Tax=Fibroporia radiculosa TaxID=599839 RepID=J4I9D4_9APHY|nr:uncharacterized protein FIBRA_03014 [Fibroporia radiculosa]CCM00966.1 predicted protein [Fibroporia radiculosa]
MVMTPDDDGIVSANGDVVAFKNWLAENGAEFHPHAAFRTERSGYSVIASQDLRSDTTVVSCPFSLAITPEVSKNALTTLLGPTFTGQSWSERQLICSYICMHWILDPSASSELAHWPYIRMLPAPDKLRTPLHFSDTELEALKGSNLYGATLDRRRDWQSEWEQCQKTIATVDLTWGEQFSWERYLSASTYLSSRAFPSMVLSPNPSLVSTEESYPVLLPGIDSLNHSRGQPVSWVVSIGTSSDVNRISLVLHKSTPAGSELLNNYGPKPNAELILGYGFSLPENPDDTIVLKIGGNSASGLQQQKWEVGRNAQGAGPMWRAILTAVSDDPEEQTIDDELDASEVLAEMAQNLLDRLPIANPPEDRIRPEVLLMLEHYLEGQRAILQSLIQFARDKESAAIKLAQEQGLQTVEEDENEDM